MKKLFLFTAGGNGAYLGGMAGATGENWQDAWEKLQHEDNGQCCYFDVFYSTDKERGSNWGMIPYKQVWSEEDLIFIEIHDG